MGAGPLLAPHRLGREERAGRDLSLGCGFQAASHLPTGIPWSRFASALSHPLLVDLGPPVVPFLPCLGEGSPEIDYREQIGYPYSNLSNLDLESP